MLAVKMPDQHRETLKSHGSYCENVDIIRLTVEFSISNVLFQRIKKRGHKTLYSDAVQKILKAIYYTA